MSITSLLQKRQVIEFLGKSLRNFALQLGAISSRFAAHLDKPKDLKGFLVHAAKIVRTRRERGLTLDDALLFLVHFYALLPPGEDFYPEDEDRLQSAMSEAIVEDAERMGESPVVGRMVRELGGGGDGEVDDIAAYQVSGV